MKEIGFPNSNRFFVNKHFYTAVFLILTVVSTMRHAFIDTYTYKDVYHLSVSHSYAFNPKLHDMEESWYHLNYYLNQISTSPKMIMGLVAIVIIGSYLLVIKKYSSDPIFSILLFFFLQFMDTNNGMRQMLAAGLVIVGCTLALQRKWWGYLSFIALVILAMQFHESAKLIFVLVLLVIGDPFNLRIKIVTVLAVVFAVVPDFFSNVLGDLLEDSRYNYYLEYTNGMSFLRVLIVGVIPLVLSVIYIKQNSIKIIDRDEAIIINFLFLNSAFVLMGFTTQFWARLAFYTAFAPMIMIPKYINTIFPDKNRLVIKPLIIILYFIFFAYNIYVNIDYGAMKDFYWSWT